MQQGKMQHEKKKKMKKTSCNKGLLLPWLRRALDNNLYEGLRWDDKRKKIFYVHWTHKSAEQWSLSEIEVSQEWAAHKGKLCGKNEKQLKATFRCALNSKKELKELRPRRTKRLRYWQFVDNPVESVELKENNKDVKKVKLTLRSVETPGTSAGNICDRLSPSTTDFNTEAINSRIKLPPFEQSFYSFAPLTPPRQSNESTFMPTDFRIRSCSPPSEQNRLTPPADVPDSIYQHSSSINTLDRTSTDIWQPNFMSIPNGLRDFMTFNQFSQQLDELIRPMTKELFTENSMSNDIEMNQDQFVPVMNNFQNSATMEQFGYADKDYSRNTMYNSTNLDDDYMLDLDVDPIDCEKLIQEFNMLTSAYAVKHGEQLKQQYPPSYEA